MHILSIALCLFLLPIQNRHDPVMLGAAIEVNLQKKEVKVTGKMLVEGKPSEDTPITTVTFATNENTTYHNISRVNEENQASLKDLSRLIQKDRKVLVYVFHRPGTKPLATGIIYKQVDHGP